MVGILLSPSVSHVFCFGEKSSHKKIMSRAQTCGERGHPPLWQLQTADKIIIILILRAGQLNPTLTLAATPFPPRSSPICLYTYIYIATTATYHKRKTWTSSCEQLRQLFSPKKNIPGTNCILYYNSLGWCSIHSLGWMIHRSSNIDMLIDQRSLNMIVQDWLSSFAVFIFSINIMI